MNKQTTLFIIHTMKYCSISGTLASLPTYASFSNNFKEDNKNHSQTTYKTFQGITVNFFEEKHKFTCDNLCIKSSIYVA